MILTLVNNNLIQYSPTWIIAPHGLTDYIHARKYELLPKLYKINLLSLGSAVLCHVSHFDGFIHAFFLISSAVHFRNDMPSFHLKNNEKIIFQLLCSTALVLAGPSLQWNLFLYYMLFVHVPNHFKMSFEYIKQHILETISLILGFAFLLQLLSYNPMLNGNASDFDFLTKALIIAHIAYEELHVFTDLPVVIKKINRTYIRNILDFEYE